MGWGLFLCIIFTVASAYSGLKVGQVMEAAIPDLHPGHRPRPRVPAAFDPARERDHHQHRRHLGRRRRRARSSRCRPSTSSTSTRIPLQTIFICLAGGCLGVLFLIPLRRYFVRETARPVPLPRGHGHHRGPGHGREGRLAGQAPAPGHGHRRRLRLLRHHIPGVAGDRGLPVHPGDEVARRSRAGWCSASTPSPSSSASAT